MTMNNYFVAARERAGIENLRFHDLRHTATSRLAEKLPNVIELASVPGHQTIQRECQDFCVAEVISEF
jgi:integrase